MEGFFWFRGRKAMAMNCPSCGSPVNPGDAFCGACGRPVQRPEPGPGAQQPVSPPPTPPQVTAQQPTVPIASAPTPPAQATQPQPAAPGAWQPTQQMPQIEGGTPYPPHATAQPGAYAPQPGHPPQTTYQPTQPAAGPTARKGLGAGAIAGIIVGAMAVLGLVAALVVFAVLPRFRGAEAPSLPPAPVEEPTPAPAEPPVAEIPEGVFPEALDAAKAELPQDYVIELAEETDERKVYWAGPPNSEWDAVIVVDRVEQGWKVTESAPFNASEPSEDPGDTAAPDSAAAEDIVKRFLTAIKNDKPNDSQRLTISPLRDDPASAQYSNGEFKKFTIDRTEAEDDGTFWVYTTQTWSYGTEKWRYDVVPTEAGLRIRNLEYVE